MFRALPMLLLLATACSGGDPAPTAPTAPTAPEAAPPAPEAAPAAAGAPWTLVGVTNGDSACYIELTPPGGGENKTFPSDFGLCAGEKDASALIGKPVLATFKKETIQSPECQGDPECTKTVEVEGVDTLTAAP